MQHVVGLRFNPEMPKAQTYISIEYTDERKNDRRHV